MLFSLLFRLGVAGFFGKFVWNRDCFFFLSVKLAKFDRHKKRTPEEKKKPKVYPKNPTAPKANETNRVTERKKRNCSILTGSQEVYLCL